MCNVLYSVVGLRVFREEDSVFIVGRRLFLADLQAVMKVKFYYKATSTLIEVVHVALHVKTYNQFSMIMKLNQVCQTRKRLMDSSVVHKQD